MAPTQPSGSAGPGPVSAPGSGEPAAAGQRPEGFEHQQYEHNIPGADVPLVGSLTAMVGAVLDTAQRVGLADGVSMRPAASIPHTNADSYEHPELKRMIDESRAAQVHELGQLWNDLGNEIMDFGAVLDRTANSSEAIWVGQAGDAARTTLSGLATWSQHTGQGVQYMGTTMRTQADAADQAKAAMPEPVPYEPAVYQERINSTNNPIEWIKILGDAHDQAQRHNAAHAEAVRVTETYSASLHGTSATMPAFTPPPEFGSADTGLSSGRPMPGGAGGGAGGAVPGAGGPGAGTPGGPGSPAVPGYPSTPGFPSDPANPGYPPGPGVPPPAPTPGQLTPHAPVFPGAGPPGGIGPSGGGAAGIPAFLPAAAGIGGAGGGFGPRGSGGPGAPPSLGRGGFGSAGAAEGAAGAGRAAAGMAGRGLGPGAGGGFAPMAGAGRGRGEDDVEHRRPSYLIETEDVWGDGRRVAPPVIGEEPPDYYG